MEWTEIGTIEGFERSVDKAKEYEIDSCEFDESCADAFFELDEGLVCANDACELDEASECADDSCMLEEGLDCASFSACSLARFDLLDFL